ncbi:AsmA-like C-terminal region-containing protein [Jannaschia sp. KMU-145]|uniref:AsmA-like C-terminal region-containing protein n=1 Tax=Jannaschia halovivens TaxID=3388667 RepID=UPI00396B0408
MPDTPARRRRPFRAMGVVLLVVAALLAGSAWRLTEGPVALPDWAVSRLEARLSRDLGGRAVRLGSVALGYDLGAQALRLRLRDAGLSDDGTDLLALPDAQVALDGAALMRGKLRPRQVTVVDLSLDIARDADGRFNLAFGGGGGALPSNWVEGLAALDAALAVPVLADLDRVRIDGVRLRLSDAVTGLSQRIENGAVTLTRAEDAVTLDLGTDIPLPGGRTARLAATMQRLAAGEGALARLALTDLPVAALAEALPRVPALSLAMGDLSASAGVTLTEAGEPGPLRGQIALRDGRMVDRPDYALDRATLGFAWLPGTDRIALEDIAASSDDLSVQAGGQILLEDGITGPAQIQLRLGRTLFDPDGMFDRSVAFDNGLVEARVTQAPLALRIGQAMVTGPSGTARATGRIGFVAGGLDGSLRLTVPEMAVDDLTALWPPDVAPQARNWYASNLRGGIATDANAAIRLRPEAAPEVLGSFAFSGGRFRYMRHMPLAEGAAGAAQLDDRRFSIRLDAGTVPGIGPGGDAAAAGRIDLAGSRFVILDATERPATGELDLLARGAVGDLLALMDNRPFRLLERLRKDRTLASGRAEARVAVTLPLRKGNAPADITYDVAATLRDVVSEEIVPGRRIAADRLELRALPGLVEIAGDAAFEGIPFSGRWRQVLPPPSDVPIDPDATPPPPRPLPEPGRVSGTVRLTPEGLDRLGIALGAVQMSGETPAEVAITLPPGAPPRLTLTSDLRGAGLSLPAIGWSKGRDRAASLALDVVLGATPEVTRLALDAPGLSADGTVTLREGGGLGVARFDRVETAFFTGPLSLTGRGQGAAPAIAIRGGQADLRRALLAQDRDGGRGNPSPLAIALDRLTVTEGIALTDLRAELRGATGQFTARVNGGSPIEGVLAPQAGGAAVQIRTGDGGGVLRSAGLFQDARGGVLTLTLRPTAQEGVYGGTLRGSNIRVRNAPALASLLQTLSVVGILEQLGGEGLVFQTVESDFALRPGDIVIQRASAVGPSMSITADGTFDLGTRRMDLQGVISPIYLVNGLFGALFSRRDEGLFGFTYQLRGAAANPQVSVDPLSILTPGIFREIFRRPPPS